MDPETIDQVIRDRFRRWGDFLRENRATPILMIGIRQPGGNPVVTTCEEVTGSQVCGLLSDALDALLHGRTELR